MSNRASSEISAQLAALQNQVAPLLKQISALEAELRDVRSREWIAANNVRLEDVADPDEKGLPYFGHIQSFAKYLRGRDCRKRWCAWNGHIFNAAEVMAGSLDYENAPGRMEHLRK